MTYRIYMTNFDYWRDESFGSVKEALEFGKSKGFEFSIHEMDAPFQILICSWSPIGGVRSHRHVGA